MTARPPRSEHAPANPHRIDVLFERIRDDAVQPAYYSALAAGLDLAACTATPIELPPRACVVIHTGWRIAIPTGYEGQVRPRSGIATKHRITLANAPGTIDADYRGEVMVPLLNLGEETFRIEHGMRIAQLVIAPVAHAAIALVDTLERTERGERGFGSTGVH